MQSHKYTLTLLLLFAPVLASAQVVNDGNETGFPVFGSFHGSKQENVSLQNGNLHFEIPLISIPQRGGHVFTYSFIYDTPTWTMVWYPTPGEPEPGYWVVNLSEEAFDGGSLWRLTKPTNWQLSYVLSTESCWNGSGYEDSNVWENFAVVDPNGTKHALPLRKAANPSCFGTPGLHGEQLTGYATDGTGIYADVTNLLSPTVRLRDGTQPLIWKDANGNTASSTSDLSGRNLLQTTVYSGYRLHTYTDANGVSRSFRVDYATYSYHTNFCSGYPAQGDTCYEAEGEIQLPWKVTGPNGLYYLFTWQNNGNLDLQRVDLPTTGYLAYTYSTFKALVGARKPVNVRRAISTRTINDGANRVWTYQVAGGSTTVTDPLNHYQVHTFGEVNGSTNSKHETEIKFYRYDSPTSSTLLRTIQKDYIGANDPFGAETAASVRQIRETTTLDTGVVTKTETDFDSFTVTCSICNGGSYLATRLNPTEHREYAYGSGAAGALMRRTNKVYLHDANSAYLTPNIVDKVTRESIYDPTATLMAETQFEYDSTALVSTSSNPAPQHDYTNYSTSNTLRGNLTKIKKWRNLPTSTLLTTTLTHDDLGNKRSSLDPLNHSITWSYLDNMYGSSCLPSANTQAYVTLVTNHLNHQTQFKHYPCTGFKRSVRDQNDINASRDGTAFTYDLFGRTDTASFADGGTVHFDYNDAARWIRKSVSRTPQPDVVSYVYADMLGRTSQTKLCEDGINCGSSIKVDTTYDALGRVVIVTNPYLTTSDPTYGSKNYLYDALGRQTRETTLPDGNYTQTAYSGQWTTVIDQAGKPRWMMQDALGRLIQVNEPDRDSGAWGPGTGYWYDVLGNLKTVIQNGSRQRDFTYNSLSQLLAAQNPESGTITYAYDDDGNVAKKIDARGVITCYGNLNGSTCTPTYDGLHRVKDKSHSSGGPSWSYLYDSGGSGTNLVGRLRLVTDYATSAKEFSYDPMGRMLWQSECLPSNCGSSTYFTSAGYNIDGSLAWLKYPSTRRVDFTYDTAARLTQAKMTEFGSPVTHYPYYTATAFSPSGPATYWTLGNGNLEAMNLNGRLQLSSWGVNQGSTQLVNKGYSYGTYNNGNILGIADNLNPSRHQTFSYDYLNRIQTAYEGASYGAGRWAQTYDIDPWGNLKQTGTYSFTVPADTNNRLYDSSHPTWYTYDTAGNMTGFNDGTGIQTTNTWDAESRLASSLKSGVTTNYTYNANGMRVRKQTGSDWTEYIYFGEQVIAEKKQDTSWSDYIYAGGKRIAKSDDFDDRLYISGTNSASGQLSLYYLSAGQGLSGYVIQSGDKLHLRQYQQNSSSGGMMLTFTNGTNTNWTTLDQDGQALNADTFANQWHSRRVDLSAHAGKTINTMLFLSEGVTPAGPWGIYFDDVTLQSADGTVRPIYTSNPSISLTMGGSSGVTRTYVVEHVGGVGMYPQYNTAYYHGDHLGSARLMTNAAGGWPIWAATFLPYGQEFEQQPTTNHYKFTGKERDSESGLDYFGARYYGSTMGRFLTPDPIILSDLRLVNPQVWNMYSYVANNPLRAIDPNGEELVQLGQHSDEEIDDRIDVLKKGLKDKSLTKEQKAHVKEEIRRLQIEKEANRIVGNMLEALDKKGERNGLQLSDFTVTTDTRNDFVGVLNKEQIDQAMTKEAFVITTPNGPFMGTIFISTERGAYQQSQQDSDFVLYGATVLRHEQRHTQIPRQEEQALRLQRGIFQKYKNDFRNSDTFHGLDQMLIRLIERYAGQ